MDGADQNQAGGGGKALNEMGIPHQGAAFGGEQIGNRFAFLRRHAKIAFDDFFVDEGLQSRGEIGDEGHRAAFGAGGE